ncbi:MAG: hypothetical protein KIT32_12345 [Rhodocyclaceae bacterium]|nr:hypothetical protein [Rhodocyclaceae bacterium]
MSNTILTPTAVTREILRVLHQKANFIGTVNRQYDDSFANSGAKIGTTLKIRTPNQYTVRSGAVLDVQDTAESSVTLTVATQKGVDINFSSVELTMSLDDFSKRIIEPAVNALVATVENDMISNVYKDIYATVDNAGAAATYAKLLTGEAKLHKALAPMGDRTAMLHPQAHADMLSAWSQLFNDSKEISSQYRSGKIGTAIGFDFYRSTHMPIHTTGTETGTTMTVNGPNQTGSIVTVSNGSAKTLVAGDIVTFAGCNRVHPETKADTGELQQFVVTSAVTSGGLSIAISPSIITSGATQNVSASPTDTGAVTKALGGASSATDVSLLYHKDAFTFTTADLVMPKGVDFAAREVLDGISMRVVRQYDINNDQFPCRIDILYGYKTIRPELAVRVHNN